MKRMISFLMIAGFLIFFPATIWALPYLPSEPPLETQISWDILPNGLLVVAYDLDHNGKADFFTIRVVVKAYFSSETVSQIKVDYPGNQIFKVSYEWDSHYYIANKEPLFYAIDVNEDGIWDLTYKDEMEDGVNGNERFYESPSGLFSESSINALK